MTSPTGEAAGAPLPITIVNGNLKFVHQPLMLGHYRSVALSGAERFMDKLIGGTMSRSLAMGRYPERPGAQQVFVNKVVNQENPLQLPRPESVIVVGLGDEGKLRAVELSHTVRQGVIAWSQRMLEAPPRADGNGAPPRFELAATLIGSGGTGISAGQAACLVALGVRDANRRLHAAGWPVVSHLYLVELYLDRATEAWRALKVQATAAPGRFDLAHIVHASGGLPRPLDASYRGAEYDLISVVTVEDAHGNNGIAYTLDTKRARTEVRAQATQVPLVRELLAGASNDRGSDSSIGHTLFRLLVPVELEPFFGGTTAAVLELDRGTAGIPWELLDTKGGMTDGGDARPWAIRARLLRKLRTAGFRPRVVDATADSAVLVIAEPACDASRYPRLPSAWKEGRAVADCFLDCQAVDPATVRDLVSRDPAQVGADARTIINALHSRDWRVVHIAGHGEPPEWLDRREGERDGSSSRVGDPRGVVLSNGIFLGPREIQNLRVVPELVFMNCCHLAARDPAALLREEEHLGAGSYDRPRFAATMAEELIRIGVRCVVVAGWAVVDDAAMAFAKTFYARLLAGHRFIDAVADAREAAKACGGNTWAAYQCYGDPDWTFLRQSVDALPAPASPADEFGNVASVATLTLALRTMAVTARFGDTDRKTLPGRIDYLEKQFEEWGHLGKVAEAFAEAWVEARDRPKAIAWYRRALSANDGGASIRAAEQLGNLRARLAWESVESAQELLARCDAGQPAPPSRAEAEARLQQALSAARNEIADVLALLERLIAVQPTMERESLCGSAWKRKAMVEAVAGRAPEEAEAIVRMEERYAKAEALAREARHPDLFYPALNRMAAALIIEAGKPGWPGFDREALSAVRESLAAKVRTDPDFWSVVGQTELQLYEAVAAGALAEARASLKSAYEDLHARVHADWMWKSVRDQVRFVLPKYQARANTAEQEAVAALLERLDAFTRA